MAALVLTGSGINSVAILKEASMSMSQQSQTGSSSTWKDVPTNSVDVGGTKFVYRQLGPDTGVPVIFLNHLAAELDRWDPRSSTASLRDTA